jgi:hypothetical protein
MNIIPFLVLQRAIADADANPSEYTKRILNLVLQTCTKLVQNSENLKKEIIQLANGFIKNPLCRTADVIASIKVLTAQILCIKSLPAEEQEVSNPDP